MKGIGFWLAGFWPWWREKWNERQQCKLDADMLIYGAACSKRDHKGRVIRFPITDFYTAPTAEGKHD